MWRHQQRETAQRKAMEKKLTALLAKYKKCLDKSKKKSNLDFIYDVFDIGKSKNGCEEVKKIVDSFGNLSVDKSLEDVTGTKDEETIQAVADLSANESLEEVTDNKADPDYEPEENDSDDSVHKANTNHSRYLNIEEICKVADRRNISNRDTALIVSSTLKALGLIDEQNRDMIVDPSKVSYSRKKVRAQASNTTDMSPLLCFQFDGKSVRNLEMEVSHRNKSKQKVVKKMVQKDNIIIVKQPENILLGFVACESGGSECIFENLLSFFGDKQILLDFLLAIGCDAAAVNTGQISGIIRRFEEYLKRPLHWVICILHLNERILANIIEHLDGKTTGPMTHAGKLMNEIQTCHLRPPVAFEPIGMGELNHDVDYSQFTNDQLYLWRIAKMVESGIIDDDLCALCPGKIHNARWMTTAARLLREYCSNPRPSRNLKLLARYIMLVYVPIWFQSKFESRWYHGPKHLFELVQRTRTHANEVFPTVKKYVTYNSFFAHPENMLLAMIADRDKNIRRIGYSKIIDCRKTRTEGLRTFAKPTKKQLNFHSDAYHELLIWDKIKVFEPPFTHQFNVEELTKFMNADEVISIPEIPLHTQACEYNIQALTESVTAVAGHQNQEGYLKTKMMHRRKMGVFQTKKNFK